MKVGDLKHFIRIERLTVSNDEYGSNTETFEPFDSVFASIGGITAKSRQANTKTGQELTHSIRIRYQSGIDKKMRIIFDNRVFSIHTIINSKEENRWLDLLCEEAQV